MVNKSWTPTGLYRASVWLPPDVKRRLDAVRPSYVSQSGLIAAATERVVEALEAGLSIEQALKRLGVELSE